jgi:hypothetical protein
MSGITLRDDVHDLTLTELDEVRELTLAELDEIAGGGGAGASVEWLNGSGSATVSGFASTTSASAFISANFTPQGTGTPHELFTSAFAFVP